jgi:ribosome modulation factor
MSGGHHMDRDKFWDFHTEEGRKAHRGGQAKEDCPFIGRARLAWINGWSLEFGQSDGAKTAEDRHIRKLPKEHRAAARAARAAK